MKTFTCKHVILKKVFMDDDMFACQLIKQIKGGKLAHLTNQIKIMRWAVHAVIPIDNV